MTEYLFNRTILLWAGAIAVFLLIVNPRAALFQRVNTMNENYVACISQDHCRDKKAITEAREYYMVLSQLYPDYGRGFEMEGVCNVLLKQDHLAIKDFEKAIKHNPNLFWASFELGKAFYRKGEYSQAFKYFKGIISQNNNVLLNKALLPGFSKQISNKTKEGLMMSLIVFVTEIKLRSYQMAIGSLIHQGNIAQVKDIINSNDSNQQYDVNEFLKLVNNSIGKSDSTKAMLSWIDSLAYSDPFFHPWGHVIQPLKELLWR